MRKLLNRSNYIHSLYYRVKYFYYDNFLDNKKSLEKQYLKKTGRVLDLENPTLFNEKIQWLKLYWFDEFAKKCVDKYAVREIISRVIGDKYLNDIYGVYTNIDDVDFGKLPESFVIKATHSSGQNIIVKDKNNINISKIKTIVNKWMHTDYYYLGGEWVYKNIKPQVVIEKYMEDNSGELRDYKIFCFHGEPHFIQVDIGRFKKHRRNIYNLDWELLPVEIEYPKDEEVSIPRPKELEEMLELSRKLSKNFPHVRVDFYLVNHRIYFGELTFFHGSGYEKIMPTAFEEHLGSLLRLEKIKNRKYRL